MTHVTPHRKACLAAALAVGLLSMSTPASALIACSKGGDCWHAESRVRFSGIQLTFRPDTDLARIKADKQYTWHDVDNLHNWLGGYWLFGQWYEALPEKE